MVPHWHTYWKFPGDAGLPTEIKWNLPPVGRPAISNGPFRSGWRIPGDIEIYGYEDEVLLMQEITPPASLSDSTVQLGGEASWLVCEKICIPGSAKLQLDLPVAAQERSGKRGDFFAVIAARFRRIGLAKRRQCQLDAERCRAPADRRKRRAGELSGRRIFPLPDENVVVGHPQDERGADGKITFRVPIETQDRNLSSLNGIVVFGQDANGPDRNAWSLTGTALRARPFRHRLQSFPAASPNFSSSVSSAGSFST